MGEGRRKGYNDFSLRISSSLSLSLKDGCMCVVENLSRVFLSELTSFTFVDNKGIYSIGEG